MQREQGVGCHALDGPLTGQLHDAVRYGPAPR
jgi:hypothetical protein